MPGPFLSRFSISVGLLRPCLSSCRDLWVQSRGSGWNFPSIGSTLAGNSEAKPRCFGHGGYNSVWGDREVANGPPSSWNEATAHSPPGPQPSGLEQLPDPLPSFLPLSPPLMNAITSHMKARPLLSPFLNQKSHLFLGLYTT